MTNRNYDWSLLKLPGDPIPGEAPHVEHSAASYRGVAEAIRQAADNLRLATDVTATVSVAVATFTALANQVMAEMSEIDDRYTGVAEQLSRFARELDEHQRGADQAFLNGVALLDDIRRARAQVLSLNDQLEDPQLAPDARGQLLLDQLHANRHLTELKARRDGYVAVIMQHVQARDAAAAAAAAAIHAVLEASTLNDAWHTKLWNGIVAVAQWFLENVDWMTFVLDMAQILLTVAAFILILTGVGAAVGVALLAVARVCGVISKVLTGLRALATVILVADGRLPASALGALVVEYAVDKIVEVASDAVADAVADDVLDWIDPDGLAMEAIQAEMGDLRTEGRGISDDAWLEAFPAGGADNFEDIVLGIPSGITADPAAVIDLRSMDAFLAGNAAEGAVGGLLESCFDLGYTLPDGFSALPGSYAEGGAASPVAAGASLGGGGGSW